MVKTRTVLPREIIDDKIGMVAKVSARIAVGRATEHRAVIISFADIGTVVAISPASARDLADELKAAADMLSQ